MDEARTFVLTAAPSVYDYGYTDEIGTVDLYPQPLRLVSVPNSHVEYQTGRYMSGLYVTVAVAPAFVGR